MKEGGFCSGMILFCIIYHYNNLVQFMYNLVHQSWRRPLLSQEYEKVEELMSFPQQVNLIEGREETWNLMADGEGTYTVKSAYNLLQGQDVEESIPVLDSLWQGTTPSKVLVFAWKVLWGRTQSKHNLFRRGIISTNDSLNCVLCSNEEESADHIFFDCSFSSQIWNTYHNWMKISTTLPCRSREHFLQHGGETWSQNQQRGTQVIWLAIIWSIWLMRNPVVFKNAEKDAMGVWELAQLRLWNWLRASCRKFHFSFYEWS